MGDGPNQVAFVVVGDVHVGHDSRAEAFPAAIDMWNQLPIDFVMFVGDLVHDVTSESVDELVAQLRRIEKPIYLALGNHETDAAESGVDLESRLAAEFPGPWQSSFSYAFEAGRWRFIFAGACDSVPSGLTHFYVNGIKGYINATGLLTVHRPEHLERFQRLLDESGDQPSCVVIHHPLARIPDRIRELGGVDQTRLIQDRQIRSLVQARRNVKAIFSGHQHFNQVDVVRHQLHCVTQIIGGELFTVGPAIRLVELSDTMIRSRLIWHDRPDEPPGEIGTLAGDRSFCWRFE